MPLLLRREETQPLLDLPKAIEITKSAFRQQAAWQVTGRMTAIEVGTERWIVLREKSGGQGQGER